MDSDSDSSEERINIYESVSDSFEKKICTTPLDLDFRHQDTSDNSEKLSVKIELTSSTISSRMDGTIHSIFSIENDTAVDFVDYGVEIISDGESDSRASKEVEIKSQAKQNFWMQQVFCSFIIGFVLLAMFVFILGGVCMPLWKEFEDHTTTYQKVQCTIVSASVELGTLHSCMCGVGCSSTYPCLRVTASYVDPDSGVPSTALLTSRFENSASCYHNLTESCLVDPAQNTQTVQGVHATLPVSVPRTCYLTKTTPHLVADGDDAPTLTRPAICTTFSVLPASVTLIWFIVSLSVYCHKYQKAVLSAKLSEMKSGSLLMKPN